MSKSTAVVKASDAVVSPVDPNQITKASKALLSHIKKATAASTAVSKNLLADEESTVAETPIWLTLTTKKHISDTNRLQPSKIVLPNPLNADNESTICIIVADPQRHYKNVVASDEFPEDLRNRITRVIDVSHLKAKFKTYEAQRQLFNDHDIFLADDRIVNRLPKHLGKTFFKSHTKRPVPVVFMKQRERVDGKRVPKPKGPKAKRDPVENVNARPTPEIVAEIRKAIGAALVSLSPSTNTAIKVGYASWEPEKLIANVEKVITDVVERFVPHKWKNVRSFYLKGPETVALPIYQTDELWLDDSKVVADGAEKPEKANIGKKRKAADDNETEEAAAENKDESRPKKKAKKSAASAAAALPESNDDKLDKEIATRKATLRKQKAAAKKAVEV